MSSRFSTLIIKVFLAVLISKTLDEEIKLEVGMERAFAQCRSIPMTITNNRSRLSVSDGVRASCQIEIRCRVTLEDIHLIWVLVVIVVVVRSVVVLLGLVVVCGRCRSGSESALEERTFGLNFGFFVGLLVDWLLDARGSELLWSVLLLLINWLCLLLISGLLLLLISWAGLWSVESEVALGLAAAAWLGVVSRIVVHVRVFAVLSIVDFASGKCWIGVGVVSWSCWSHVDIGARGLESVLIRSVFNLSLLSVRIDVAVLSFDFPVGRLCLDLKTSVSTFVAVGVAAILVVAINLLENRHWRCVLLLRQAHTNCAKKHENLSRTKIDRLENSNPLK